MGDARKAEKDGSATQAYDDYCKAARKNPGDGGAVAGLKRTGPAAAAHWQAQAWQAMEQQRYGEAWRMLMRALEIQPDDPTIVKLLLQVQQQHPTEIAEARADWLRHGSGALAMAGLEEGKSTTEPAETTGKPTVVAKAKPAKAIGKSKAAAKADTARSMPDQDSKIDQTPAPSASVDGPSSNPPEALREISPPSPQGTSDIGPLAQAKPAGPDEAPPPTGEASLGDAQKRHREWADAFAKADADPNKQAPPRSEDKPGPAAETKRPADPPPSKPPETRRSVAPLPPKPAGTKRPTEPPPLKPIEVRRSVEPLPPAPKPGSSRQANRDPGAGQLQPRPAEAPPGFIVLSTLSKKDKAFPKEAMLIDGIVIKLKGTGDDPKTDLDLCDGKKRVKKIRGLKIGASETFAGHSGVEFRLVILSIQHKTDTVRVGVQELPRVLAPAPVPNPKG
jgi:tetratricopeptide (TPR) repeat protein